MDIFSKEMLYAGGGAWVRPNLTANGTLGRNDFAVKSNPSTTTAYYAVDNSSSTTFQASGARVYFIFYNPQPLKVTKLIFKFTTSPYMSAYSVEIQGSNNDSSWTTITSSYSFNRSTLIGTAILTNNNGYKYYNIIMTPMMIRNPIFLADLQIEATI